MKHGRGQVFFFAFVLVASVASAQTGGDLVPPIIRTDPAVDANRPFSWNVDVFNAGPDAATNISVTGSTEPALQTVCSPTSVDAIAPNRDAVFQCSSQAPGREVFVTLHAHASSSNDPNPANNDATRTIRAILGPDLGISIVMPTIDPGIPFDVGLYYFNASTDVPASNVTATVTLPPQIHVVKLPDNCKIGRASCRERV